MEVTCGGDLCSSSDRAGRLGLVLQCGLQVLVVKVLGRVAMTDGSAKSIFALYWGLGRDQQNVEETVGSSPFDLTNTPWQMDVEGRPIPTATQPDSRFLMLPPIPEMQPYVHTSTSAPSTPDTTACAPSVACLEQQRTLFQRTVSSPASFASTSSPAHALSTPKFLIVAAKREAQPAMTRAKSAIETFTENLQRSSTPIATRPPRVPHNVIERRYRNHLQNRIDTLSSEVPP